MEDEDDDEAIIKDTESDSKSKYVAVFSRSLIAFLPRLT
jgi:hypothetical protein